MTWTEAGHPAVALFLRVWLWDFVLGPICAVAVTAPQALPFFPVLYFLSYGFPLVAAGIGATLHAALLALIIARFGWPKPPLDVPRYLSIGLLLGAVAGFAATTLASRLYGGFKGTGPEWHGGLAGAICAAWTTVHGLRRALRA